MKRGLLLMAAVAASAIASPQYFGFKDPPSPGATRVATEANAADVRIDQKLGERVPTHLLFTDERGHEGTIGEFIGGKPTLLLLIFYRCEGICTDELNSLTRSLKGFKNETAGDLFNVLAVSINPKEGPEMARAKKDAYMDVYDKPGGDKGWKFLTGKEENIAALAESVGFKYRYEPENDNYVHPAGLMILGPDGTISRYFVTTEYPQQILLDSIRDAGKGKVGVRDDRPFYLACINIDPLTGRRSLNILNTLKVAGILTVVILATSMIVMSRKSHQPMPVQEDAETV